MVNLVKLLAFLVVACLVAKFWSARQRVKPASDYVAVSFAPLPDPWLTPSDRLLILTPPNSSNAERLRSDALADQLTRDGIPFKRARNMNLNASRDTTDADVERVRPILMSGDVPIVYISGRVANNPSAAEVEAEYRRTQ